MLILSEADIQDLLTMADTIEIVDQVLRSVSKGEATLPLRSVMPVGGDNKMGIMPGAIAAPNCYGIKLVSLFPGNPERGLSSHRGAMILFEAETGGAIAMMDASLLTAMRTAAASAVATRVLAQKDRSRLTILGTGEQAEFHAHAMLELGGFETVTLAGRSLEKAQRLADVLAVSHPNVEFSASDDFEISVRTADVICTTTASKTPILKGDWIQPGTHLNIVGSSIPSMREVDDDLVHRSSIWVDYLPSALAQAGEIIECIAAGSLKETDLAGEIGACLSGEIEGRKDDAQITVYRSLGIAAQDLATAHFLYERAKATGRGVKVTM